MRTLPQQDSLRYPRILLITSCTGEKRTKPDNQLTQEDFRDKQRLHSREAELAQFACRAAQLYTGTQHLRAMEGVSRLRQAFGDSVIDVMILSAGYGLISEARTIVPYEVTFSTMKGDEIDKWAKFLGIHQAFEQAIAPYDLIFLLLGESYLRSLCLPVEANPQQTFVFLASKGGAAYES